MYRSVQLGGNLGYVAGLRTLLTFHNLELYGIAFLKALVTFILDRAVVNKNIGSVFAADETESFCIIEPLNGSFQTCHLPSSVTCIRTR
jgi:hypothetical protein